jgi:hypothetical protein
MSSQRLFLVRWRGQQMGPYSVQTIQEKLAANEFGLMHEIQANNTWVTLDRFFQPVRVPQSGPPPTITNLASIVSPKGAGLSTPPALRVPGSTARRSRMLYILLAATGGYAGIHNFYAGAWLRAVLQLSSSLLGILLGIGIFIPWLWAALEMLFMRTDGKGRQFS